MFLAIHVKETPSDWLQLNPLCKRKLLAVLFQKNLSWLQLLKAFEQTLQVYEADRGGK
jgi:hypothetical protein